MHPTTHSSRRYTVPTRPKLPALRAVLGLAPAGEPVPGLSQWRQAADTRTVEDEK